MVHLKYFWIWYYIVDLVLILIFDKLDLKYASDACLELIQKSTINYFFVKTVKG